jgi:hypothetical protein
MASVVKYLVPLLTEAGKARLYYRVGSWMLPPDFQLPEGGLGVRNAVIHDVPSRYSWGRLHYDVVFSDAHRAAAPFSDTPILPMLDRAFVQVPIRLPARYSDAGVAHAYNRAAKHLQREVVRLFRKLGLGGTGLPFRADKVSRFGGWPDLKPWQHRLGPLRKTMHDFDPELADFYVRRAAQMLNDEGEEWLGYNRGRKRR